MIEEAIVDAYTESEQAGGFQLGAKAVGQRRKLPSMSEYQYYEFHAIDRSLTGRQMKELRAISTRATISRTLFSNHYTYGDLKANPGDLLARYFDASLYFAYWHVVEVAFRFSGSAIDLKSIRRYRAGESLNIRSVGHDVIITLCAERDDFDAEDDGRGWLSPLTPLRGELVSGDERALYLAWLLGVQHGEIDERRCRARRQGARAPRPPTGRRTRSVPSQAGEAPSRCVAACRGARRHEASG